MSKRHSGILATNLDMEMILRHGATIYDSDVPDAMLPQVTDLERELGGRLLLRYVRSSTVASYSMALPTAVWPQTAYVTPTAYCRSQVKGMLNLPPSLPAPSHAVLLDPAGLVACGPRRIRFGHGVEYVLPGGFTQPDIAWPNWPVALA